jgi:hypothetical protein
MIYQALPILTETAFGSHPCVASFNKLEMPSPFHGKLVARLWHALVTGSMVPTGKPVFEYKHTNQFLLQQRSS